MKKLLFLAAAALTAFAAQAQKIQIFDHTQVHAFGSYEEFKPDSAGVLHAGTGRYIFKKVNFPTYKRTTRATINITLASNGDRWDKSGSCGPLSPFIKSGNTRSSSFSFSVSQASSFVSERINSNLGYPQKRKQG